MPRQVVEFARSAHRMISAILVDSLVNNWGERHYKAYSLAVIVPSISHCRPLPGNQGLWIAAFVFHEPLYETDNPIDQDEIQNCNETEDRRSDAFGTPRYPHNEESLA